MEKRIGEHVFKRTHEDGFDLTLMCGVDAMLHCYETYDMDIFDFCNLQLEKNRPGLARILEIYQVPEGKGKKRTMREILSNWFLDGEHCDSPEFLAKLFDGLNAITGKNYHKLYAALLAPEVTEELAEKKAATTPSAD